MQPAAGGHRVRHRSGAGDDERARRGGHGRDQRRGGRQRGAHAGDCRPRSSPTTRDVDLAVLRVPRPAGASAGVRARGRRESATTRSCSATRSTARSPPTPARIRRPDQAARAPTSTTAARSPARCTRCGRVVRCGNSGGPMIDPDGKVDRRGVRRGPRRLGDRLRAHRRPGGPRRWTRRRTLTRPVGHRQLRGLTVART